MRKFGSAEIKEVALESRTGHGENDSDIKERAARKKTQAFEHDDEDNSNVSLFHFICPSWNELIQYPGHSQKKATGCIRGCITVTVKSRM
jgi:hypothetical protein